jgi:hypothetical protein
MASDSAIDKPPDAAQTAAPAHLLHDAKPAGSQNLTENPENRLVVTHGSETRGSSDMDEQLGIISGKPTSQSISALPHLTTPPRHDTAAVQTTENRGVFRRLRASSVPLNISAVEKELPLIGDVAAPMHKSGHMSRSEGAGSLEHWKTKKDAANEVLGTYKNVAFNIEASLKVAQHFLSLIPYRRLPMATMIDGTPLDLNPPQALDPAEVSQHLERVNTEAGAALQTLVTATTGSSCEPYNIPANVITAAMLRGDGGSFVDKVRRQYAEEFKHDAVMKDVLVRAGTVPFTNLGSPPPVRQPSAEITTNTVGLVPATNRIKIEAGVLGASIPPTTVVPAVIPVIQKSAIRKRNVSAKSPAEKLQTYRENPKNGTVVYLGATESDILQTYRSMTGRVAYNTYGVIYPPSTVHLEDKHILGPIMQNLPAKMCKNDHKTRWILLCSGEIHTCSECNHGNNFEQLDIFLPPNTRVLILKLGAGIDQDGRVMHPDGKLTEQPNHIVNLKRGGELSCWVTGETYFRKPQIVPDHIILAAKTSKIVDMAKKITANDSSRWLRLNAKDKPVFKPDFDGRKLKNGGRLRSELKKFENIGGRSVDKFLAARMLHVWTWDDMADDDDDVQQLARRMAAKFQIYYDSGVLTDAQFDVNEDWLFRSDIEEFNRCGEFESLLVDTTGRNSEKLNGKVAKSKGKNTATASSSQLSLRGTLDPLESHKRKSSALEQDTGEEDKQPTAKNLPRPKKAKVVKEEPVPEQPPSDG